MRKSYYVPISQLTPEQAEERRAKDRARYAKNPKRFNDKSKRYYARNPEKFAMWRLERLVKEVHQEPDFVVKKPQPIIKGY